MRRYTEEKIMSVVGQESTEREFALFMILYSLLQHSSVEQQCSLQSPSEVKVVFQEN